MDIPLEITFRGLDQSADLEHLIRVKAAKLKKLCSDIVSLRVTVEEEFKPQNIGLSRSVRLECNVPPSKDLVIKREAMDQDQHKDVGMLLREAFEAAWVTLQKLREKQKGKVKTHPEQEVVALVDRLFYHEGFGFLKTIDGRDVYFHRNSVLGRNFDDLKPGDGVTFAAEMGEEGLRATSVHLVGRPAS